MIEKYANGVGMCEGLVRFEMCGSVAIATAPGCLFRMVGHVKRFTFHKLSSGLSRRFFRSQVKRMIRNTHESERFTDGA